MTPVDPAEAALATAAAAQQSASDTLKTARETRELIQAQSHAPRVIAKTLTQAVPIVRDEARDHSASIGLLNPSGARVLIGHMGRARANAGAVPLGPRRILVLPFGGEDIELGADTTDPDTNAALAAGDQLIYLLRFEAVQPLALALLT